MRLRQHQKETTDLNPKETIPTEPSRQSAKPSGESDLNQLVGFGMNLLMYATPVIYAFSTVSPELRPWLEANPLVAPVESFKYAFFGLGSFSAMGLLYSFGWMVLLIFVGLILFNRAERNFMDIV